MSNLQSSLQVDDSLEARITSDLFDLEQATPNVPPDDGDHPFDDWVDAVDDPGVANDMEISAAAGETEGYESSGDRAGLRERGVERLPTMLLEEPSLDPGIMTDLERPGNVTSASA